VPSLIDRSTIAAVPKPIHAKTLVNAANSSAGHTAAGTCRLSPRARARLARISAAATPATPRENSGGHSRSNSLMKAQLSAQPVTVTASRAKPAIRASILSVGMLRYAPASATSEP
jgi:hypothetical protein